MTISRSNPTPQQYIMNEAILEQASAEKDLGVIITSKMSFKKHTLEKKLKKQMES